MFEGKNQNSLFTPRHDFFSLDAGAPRESCGNRFSKLRKAKSDHYVRFWLWFTAKDQPWFKARIVQLALQYQRFRFIVNLGDRALSIGVTTQESDTLKNESESVGPRGIAAHRLSRIVYLNLVLPHKRRQEPFHRLVSLKNVASHR